MQDSAESVSRTGPELIAATRAFAKEIRLKSWWYFWTAALVTACMLVGAAIAPYWWVKLPMALVGSLSLVRFFILYHDYMHGSILRKSWLARVLMYGFGLVFLTPPYHWRTTHNFHHANVGTLAGSNTGSYPIMTVQQWQQASFGQRLYYRVARHPVTILLAYATVFVFSNSLLPAIRNPRKEWTGFVALVAHGGLIAGLWLAGGFWTAFWAWILPYAPATALGAYLFYAQHNFPGMKILSPETWTMAEASMKSCSYLKTGPFMGWFTGEIGFHHVHHLNAGIPFYRLEEAMEQLPEARNPAVTTLRPKDIVACFRLKIWDDAKGQMVSYREAARAVIAGGAAGGAV